MPDPTNPDENSSSKPRRGCATWLIYPVGFFALGAAMLIWPNAMGSSVTSCGPESIRGDTLDCFIGGEWGRPEAVALCFIVSLLMTLSAIRGLARAAKPGE